MKKLLLLASLAFAQACNTAPEMNNDETLDLLHQNIDTHSLFGGLPVNVTVSEDTSVVRIGAGGTRNDMITLDFNEDSVAKYQKLGRDVYDIMMIEVKGAPMFYDRPHHGAMTFLDNSHDIALISGPNCPQIYISGNSLNTLNVTSNKNSIRVRKQKAVVKVKEPNRTYSL